MVELITVMAIVAVSAAVSIPVGLTYVRDHQAAEAARTVADYIADSRRQAIQSNAPQGMLLSVDGPQQLTLAENPRPGVRDHLAPEGAPARQFTLPEGYELVAANGPRAAFVFRADGTVGTMTQGSAIPNFIGIEGMNFVLQIRDAASGVVQDLLIGRSGQVVAP